MAPYLQEDKEISHRLPLLFFLAALLQHNLARGSRSCFFFFLTLWCPHFKFPYHMQDIYLAENFLANVIIK